MKLLIFDIDVSLSVKYLSVAISSWQMNKELQDCMWEIITNLQAYRILSFMKMRKINGPNMEPCGTLLLLFVITDI